MKQLISSTAFATILILLSGCGRIGCKRVPSDEQYPISVKTTTVGISEVSSGKSYSGTIEEAFGSVVAFQTGGTLKQVLISEGQVVAAGQLLAVVDDQTMEAAVEASDAQIKLAEDALEQAQDFYDRMKILHDKGSVPDVKWIDAETKLKQAQSAVKAAKAGGDIYNKQLSDTRLYAPYAGYVSNKLVEVGQVVGPGTPVAKIVKIDRVKVKISVPEAEIGSVSKGRSVLLTVEALGGASFTGTITEKGVTANPVSHTYDVRATIENKDHRLLPGMVCTLRIGTDELEQGIVLPADIIQIDYDNLPFVWCVVDGKAQKVFVQTGDNVPGGVTVTEGLKAGDIVIIEGQTKVSNGMSVICE